MYSAIHKIHLWVGLVLALVILSEAVTGLVLSEHWIIGQPQNEAPRIEKVQMPQLGNALPPKGEIRNADNVRIVSSNFNPIGFAKGLHQGKIGNLDLKWLVNLAGLGIIVLTLTGIYMSIVHRQMRRIRR